MDITVKLSLEDPQVDRNATVTLVEKLGFAAEIGHDGWNLIETIAVTGEESQIRDFLDQLSGRNCKRVEIISLLVGCLNEEDVLHLVAQQLGDDARTLLAGDLGLSD